MTHIENIPHIFGNGITHKDSVKSNQNYKSIGDNSLINTRDSFDTPNGDLLGDYIPFYLGCRTPMLYVIQKGYNGVKITKPSKIIYCVTSIQKIIDANLNFIYTDGHATNGFSKYYTPKDIKGIKNQLDFKAINAKFWNDENDLDLKRRKEAEFLIKQDLEYNDILGFITFDQNSKQKLLGMGVQKKIIVKPNLYF
ncbi:type II toxin-antitoxin system toxin DNA ADP-ribosyl transferase DarT [Pontimicrobium sp. MEBiC06410]